MGIDLITLALMKNGSGSERLAGTEIDVKEILPQSELTASAQSYSNEGVVYSRHLMSIEPSVMSDVLPGDYITIILNGTKYKAEYKKIGEYKDTALIYGFGRIDNTGSIVSDLSIPIGMVHSPSIESLPETVSIHIYDYQIDESKRVPNSANSYYYTVQILREREVVHQLDPKYIPDDHIEKIADTRADAKIGTLIENGQIGAVEGGDIEWDGDTTGRYVVEDAICHISDRVFTADEVEGFRTVFPNGTVWDVYEDRTIATTTDGAITEHNDIKLVVMQEQGAVALGTQIGDSDPAAEMVMSIPNDSTLLQEVGLEKGGTFCFIGEDVYVSRIYLKGTVHQIDDKFISEEVDERVANKVLRELGIDKKTETATLLPETSVLNSDENVAACNTPIVLGQTYTVTFNGKVYSCIAKNVTTSTGNFIAVGNGGLVGGDMTAEPFFLAIVAEGQIGIVVAEDGTISVTTETTTTTPIKPEYLPSVCLPVVEVYTAIPVAQKTEQVEAAVLTKEECDQLNNLFGTPFYVLIAFCEEVNGSGNEYSIGGFASSSTAYLAEFDAEINIITVNASNVTVYFTFNGEQCNALARVN